MTDALPADVIPVPRALDQVRIGRPGRSARPRVLFVSHTATMSGAELVLRDAVRPWTCL